MITDYLLQLPRATYIRIYIYLIYNFTPFLIFSNSLNSEIFGTVKLGSIRGMKRLCHNYFDYPGILPEGNKNSSVKCKLLNSMSRVSINPATRCCVIRKYSQFIIRFHLGVFLVSRIYTDTRQSAIRIHLKYEIVYYTVDK